MYTFMTNKYLRLNYLSRVFKFSDHRIWGYPAEMMMITALHMLFGKFLRILVISNHLIWPHDIIQNATPIRYREISLEFALIYHAWFTNSVLIEICLHVSVTSKPGFKLINDFGYRPFPLIISSFSGTVFTVYLLVLWAESLVIVYINVWSTIQ